MTNKDKEPDINQPDNIKPAVNPKIIELIKGLNISSTTLLSTDYLNHFNEIIMMIAMIGEMPDIIEECKEWQPKSYIQHFTDTSLSYRFIAIELYRAVPKKNLDAFEQAIEQTNNAIFQTVERLELAISNGATPEELTQKAMVAQKALQTLTEIISSIIHGAEKALSQSEIDKLITF
ncbi:MAG: hypothetical protein AB7U85_03855 [Alphaproteobacteria bacterium]